MQHIGGGILYRDSDTREYVAFSSDRPSGTPTIMVNYGHSSKSDYNTAFVVELQEEGIVRYFVDSDCNDVLATSIVCFTQQFSEPHIAPTDSQQADLARHRRVRVVSPHHC